MQYRKIKGRKHCVYESIEEFKKNNSGIDVDVDVKKWSVGEEGDWVEADDGGVLQILKRGSISHPNDRKNWRAHDGYVRTVVGTFLINDKTYMDTDFSQHPNRYTFSKKIKDTTENFRTRKNVTKKEKLFATEVVVGKDAVSAYQNVYNEENFGKAKQKALLLLKQERVMKEIESNVLDIVKGLGIDHEYVLTRLKCLADNSDDDNIILQSSKELGKIIGTSGQVIKQKEVGLLGVFKGFSPEQLEKAERKQIEE